MVTKVAKNKLSQKEKNQKYWEDRIANRVWKIYNCNEERNRELLEFYLDASKAIKEELYELAEKYGKDGVLSLSEMHKKNRLTELNRKYEDIAKNLGEKIEKTATDNMHESFKDAYKEVAAGMGDTDFAMPNKKLMDKLLDEPWRGDNFSGRLWKNTKKLAVGLNSILLTGLQQGKTVTEIAVGLHNFTGQSFNSCHRLVRTETMHYLNSATIQRYKDAGVKYVQVIAAQDERTCDTCGAYNGKIYQIDKCPVLPFHANCRCTIVPCLDEKKSVANEAVRNTNTPVKYNEKYDYAISINGANETVNKSISECARKVAKFGTQDGKEHMFLVNVTTGKPVYYEKGMPGEVGGTEFWEFVDAHKEESFAFIHNHNTDGYFSETDMRTLLRTEQIYVMIAVRNDAVIYLAEKGKEVPKSGYFDDLFEKELKQLNEDVRSGKVSVSDRNIKREEIIVDGLLKRYTKAGRLIEKDGRTNVGK